MSREYSRVMSSRDEYYIKKNGRYIKAHDPGCLDGLTNGSWLVVVKRGSVSCKQYLKPKLMELEAALRYLEDGLCEAMIDASKIRSRNTKISDKERKAWDVFEKTMGKDMPTYFEYASTNEIIQKGCAYLRKIMLENNLDADKIKSKYEIKKVIDTILDLEV